MPDYTKRDRLGIPRPRITYRLDDYTKAGLAEARRIHQEAFTRLRSMTIAALALRSVDAIRKSLG